MCRHRAVELASYRLGCVQKGCSMTYDPYSYLPCYLGISSNNTPQPKPPSNILTRAFSPYRSYHIDLTIPSSRHRLHSIVSRNRPHQLQMDHHNLDPSQLFPTAASILNAVVFVAVFILAVQYFKKPRRPSHLDEETLRIIRENHEILVQVSQLTREKNDLLIQENDRLRRRIQFLDGRQVSRATNTP